MKELARVVFARMTSPTYSTRIVVYVSKANNAKFREELKALLNQKLGVDIDNIRHVEARAAALRRTPELSIRCGPLSSFKYDYTSYDEGNAIIFTDAALSYRRYKLACIVCALLGFGVAQA